MRLFLCCGVSQTTERDNYTTSSFFHPTCFVCNLRIRDGQSLFTGRFALCERVVRAHTHRNIEVGYRSVLNSTGESAGATLYRFLGQVGHPLNFPKRSKDFLILPTLRIRFLSRFRVLVVTR